MTTTAPAGGISYPLAHPMMDEHLRSNPRSKRLPRSVVNLSPDDGHVSQKRPIHGTQTADKRRPPRAASRMGRAHWRLPHLRFVRVTPLTIAQSIGRPDSAAKNKSQHEERASVMRRQPSAVPILSGIVTCRMVCSSDPSNSQRNNGSWSRLNFHSSCFWKK